MTTRRRSTASPDDRLALKDPVDAGHVHPVTDLAIVFGSPPDLEEKVVKLAAERPPDVHGEVHDELLQLLEGELAVPNAASR